MKRIPEGLVQEIQARNDILAVVGNFVRLEKHGSRWIGLCPFHNEKTPSFGVQPDKGFFYCFGCKKGGDSITFIKEIEKCGYIEAIERLAGIYGIPLVYEGSDDPAALQQQQQKEALYDLYKRLAGTFHHLLLADKKGEQALEYILARGFSRQTIEAFSLGYVPEDRGWVYNFLRKKAYSPDFLQRSGLFSSKYPEFSIFTGRLVFPIYDYRDRPVAFGGRTLTDRGPKYINSPETELFRKNENLFGLSAALPAIRESKKVIICEGYLDVMAFFEAGLPLAVAPLGTAFTDTQAQLLQRYAETAVLCFDADRAGIDATLRAFRTAEIRNLAVQVMKLPDAKDPAEILQKKGAHQLKISLESTITKDDYILERARILAEATGTAEAYAFIFEYAGRLDSEIQKDELLGKMAAAFSLDPYSVFADFKKYIKKTETVSGVRQQENRVESLPTAPVDTGLIAALALNPEYFHTVRSELGANDFEDEALKDAYIVMEELFRKDELTIPNIIAGMRSDVLRAFIQQKGSTGDYALNPERFITDGLFRVRNRRLEQQKIKLVSRIKGYDPVRDADEVSLNDLLYEKMHLDGELARLKEEWHERN